ncbi:MAG: DNA polymerase/3'-5' exonuclease PolX [Candidatus Micrarchaeota archaeon]
MALKNADIARVLYAIAELLDMQGVPFKPRAYEKAARTIESLHEEASDIYRKGGTDALEELPGIGEAIAKKIGELLDTGKLAYYEELKKQFPLDVEELMSVPGMGPKRIKLVYDKLGVKTLADLREAAKAQKLRGIPGLGPKMEEDILRGIELVGGGKEKRFPIGHIASLAEEIRARIAAQKSVSRVEIAGSYRRMKESVGDLDFLIISEEPESVMDFVTKMEEVRTVEAKGKTKSAVLLRNSLHVDFRVLGEDEFGSALQYFTGNKDHNVALRKLANAKGLTLNEYGLFTIKGKKRVAGKSEEEIYRKLGLAYVEPEMRENSGEIEAAGKGKLPELVRLKDVKGDFQTQTSWSDGNDSIAAMAETARGMGHEFIAITDHGGSFLKIAHALDEKRLAQQAKEIEAVEKKTGIRIFKGSEVDILKDGTLALSRKALEGLDFVLAAVHSGFKMEEKEMTKRMVDAIESYPIHALAHPTGRVINQREPYAVNLDTVFDACRKTGTFVEIDGFPDRLDLKDVHIRAAKEAGCRFTLSTDAHNVNHMGYLKFAVAQARRGWLEAKDILNTYPVKRIEKELAKRR